MATREGDVRVPIEVPGHGTFSIPARSATQFMAALQQAEHATPII